MYTREPRGAMRVLYMVSNYVYHYTHKEVYNMRTNIEIDEEMMRQAFSVSDFKTKKDIVAQALKEFVHNRTRKDLTDLHGKISFVDGYDYKAAREARG